MRREFACFRHFAQFTTGLAEGFLQYLKQDWHLLGDRVKFLAAQCAGRQTLRQLDNSGFRLFGTRAGDNRHLLDGAGKLEEFGTIGFIAHRAIKTGIEFCGRTKHRAGLVSNLHKLAKRTLGFGIRF